MIRRFLFPYFFPSIRNVRPSYCLQPFLLSSLNSCSNFLRPGFHRSFVFHLPLSRTLDNSLLINSLLILHFSIDSPLLSFIYFLNLVAEMIRRLPFSYFFQCRFSTISLTSFVLIFVNLSSSTLHHSEFSIPQW